MNRGVEYNTIVMEFLESSDDSSEDDSEEEIEMLLLGNVTAERMSDPKI